MSSDELRDAIAGALYVRDRFDSPTVVLADAILALPEMQTMLSKDAEIERLRAERDAIDTLHHPVSSGKDDEVCNNCGCFWPCTTHSLLHPKEARRG